MCKCEWHKYIYLFDYSVCICRTSAINYSAQEQQKPKKSREIARRCSLGVHSDFSQRSNSSLDMHHTLQL